MQSFGDLFANNRLLAIGVVLAAIAVILAVGIALFRLVFGRRLHMSGGRTRQPRLGVVDAFDLDRQRQLVLIRRDNVEHLLMIGGPNDVLIEASIVRAPVALAGRDKDNGFSPSVGIPAPMPQASTALPPGPVALPAAASAPAGGPEGGSNQPFPLPLPPEPTLGVGPEPTRAAPAVEAAPAPVAAPIAVPTPDSRLPNAPTLPPAGPRPIPSSVARPASTIPPRPPVSPVPRPATSPTPRANLSRATPVLPPVNAPAGDPRKPGPGEGVLARAPQSETERATPEPSRDASTRFPPVRTPRGDDPSTSGPAPEANPSNGAAPAQPNREDVAAPPAPPRPAPPQRPAPTSPNRTVPPRAAPAAPAPTRAPLPSLSSLEEEMAKLLGRPMPPSDSSGSNG